MHEAKLRDFFLGECDPGALAKDLEGSVRTEGINSYHDIIDMNRSFEIEPSHLILVCDAVINGKLKPQQLQQIGFCVLASDNFDLADSPKDDRIATTLHHWVAPQINHALTVANARKWRALLVTGQSPFE